jgi:hypothetical protein
MFQQYLPASLTCNTIHRLLIVIMALPVIMLLLLFSPVLLLVPILLPLLVFATSMAIMSRTLTKVS